MSKHTIHQWWGNILSMYEVFRTSHSSSQPKKWNFCMKKKQYALFLAKEIWVIMHNLIHQQTSSWGETESKQILEMLWEQEKSNMCTNYKTATFHKPPKGFFKRKESTKTPPQGVVCIWGGSTSVLKKFHLSWPYSGAEYVWSHFRLEILSYPHFKRKENGKSFLGKKTNA